jgi:hypothetical protein
MSGNLLEQEKIKPLGWINNLETLLLANNRFNGTIPDALGPP